MPASSSMNKNHEFARCLESSQISASAPFHWLALAFKDIANAPILSLVYGLVFTLIPATIMYFVYQFDTHLVILPAVVGFALIGLPLLLAFMMWRGSLKKAINLL